MPITLPMLASATAPQIPCTQCGRCCTYVAVGINPPSKPRYATDILWYLYHESVSVHLDADGEWSVIFETRCKHLGDDLLCGVYEQRPHICRAFDSSGCEVNAPGGTRVFEKPEEFLVYLEAERPELAQKIRRYRPAEPAAP
jgi:Fe-S-cluster containining protein